MRVPSELSAQADSDVVEVANGVGAHSRLNGTDRFAPCLDAFEEIAAVVVTLRQVNLIGADRRGQ